MYKIKVKLDYEYRDLPIVKQLQIVENELKKQNIYFEIIDLENIYVSELPDVKNRIILYFDILEFNNDKSTDYIDHYKKWNLLPSNVPILKHQLEEEIVITMSRGLPDVFIKQLIREKVVLTDNEFTFNYSVCEPGSNAAKHAPEHIQKWAEIIKKLIRDNIDLFKDDEYYETEGDRAVVDQIKQGVKWDKLK